MTQAPSIRKLKFSKVSLLSRLLKEKPRDLTFENFLQHMNDLGAFNVRSLHIAPSPLVSVSFDFPDFLDYFPPLSLTLLNCALFHEIYFFGCAVAFSDCLRDTWYSEFPPPFCYPALFKCSLSRTIHFSVCFFAFFWCSLLQSFACSDIFFPRLLY